MSKFPFPVRGLFRSGNLTLIIAILDQSVYALTNLVLQFLIARSVSAAEFGAYSVGLTFFFIAALLHQTCIIEPMFVFSFQRYGKQMVAYHDRLLRQWSKAFSAAVLMAGFSFAAVFKLAGSPLLAESLWAFAMISPVVLYLWLLRRLAFLLGRIDIAAIGGVIYALVLLVTVGWVWRSGELTAVVGIGLSGIAALVASLTVMTLLRRSSALTTAPTDMFLQHVRYCRWAVGTETVNWLIANGPIVVLPIWFGLSASGEFRVINLLFMPLFQIASAMTTLLLRGFTSSKADARDPATVIKFFWMLLAGAALYSLVALALGRTLVPMLFGARYVVQGHWLELSAISGTLAVAAQGFFVALRAREQSQQILFIHLFVLLVMVCLLPNVVTSGITGILFCQTVAWGLAVPLAGFMVTRTRSNSLDVVG
jgi:O-antigen/teichoic acid export membrane protein